LTFVGARAARKNVRFELNQGRERIWFSLCRSGIAVIVHHFLTARFYQRTNDASFKHNPLRIMPIPVVVVREKGEEHAFFQWLFREVTQFRVKFSQSHRLALYEERFGRNCWRK